MLKLLTPVVAIIAVFTVIGMSAASADNRLTTNDFQTPEKGDVVCHFSGQFRYEQEVSSGDQLLSESDPTSGGDPEVEVEEVTKTHAFTIVLSKGYVDNQNGGACKQFVFDYPEDWEYLVDGEPVDDDATLKWVNTCFEDLSNCSNNSNVLVAIDGNILPGGNNPINCLAELDSGLYAINSSGHNIKNGNGDAVGVAQCLRS